MQCRSRSSTGAEYKAVNRTEARTSGVGDSAAGFVTIGSATQSAGEYFPESIRATTATSHALKGHSSGMRRQIAASQQQSAVWEHVCDPNAHSPDTSAGSRSNTNSELAKIRPIDGRLTPSNRQCCTVSPHEYRDIWTVNYASLARVQYFWPLQQSRTPAGHRIVHSVCCSEHADAVAQMHAP